jgi:hypothetical protein
MSYDLKTNRRQRQQALSRCSGVPFRKCTQLGFGDRKFRDATIQADQKFWKYPDDGLVDSFQSGKMDGYLSSELPQLV